MVWLQFGSTHTGTHRHRKYSNRGKHSTLFVVKSVGEKFRSRLFCQSTTSLASPARVGVGVQKKLYMRKTKIVQKTKKILFLSYRVRFFSCMHISVLLLLPASCQQQRLWGKETPLRNFIISVGGGQKQGGGDTREQLHILHFDVFLQLILGTVSFAKNDCFLFFGSCPGAPVPEASA